MANNSHTIPGVITITQFSSIIHPKLLATASEGHCTALCGVNVVLSMMNVGTVPTNNLPLSSTQEEEGPMLNQWTQEAARVHSTKLSLPRRRWRTQASGEDKYLLVFVLLFECASHVIAEFPPSYNILGIHPEKQEPGERGGGERVLPRDRGAEAGILWIPDEVRDQ